MSTRSRIYVECDENVLSSTLGYGKVKVPHNAKFANVYCHYDGYPSGVGATLLKHYNSHEKALKLISNGDMRSVCSNIEHIEYYGCEMDFHTKPCFTANPVKHMKGLMMYNYYYVFTKKDGWKVYISEGGKICYPRSRKIYPYIKGNTIKCLGDIKEAIKWFDDNYDS